MYVVDIQKAEMDFVASLLFCVYAYTRMRRARRRCICAAPAALEFGEEGESVVFEEVDTEVEVQSEPQEAEEQETLTPSPPSQPSLASPTLSHSSPSHSSSSTSLQVNYDVEDFPIPHGVGGGQAHGQGEGALSRLDTSDYLTASSPNHVVGVGGTSGGDGVQSRQLVTQRSSSHGPLWERRESEDSTPPPILSSAREIVSPDSTSVGSEARQQSPRLSVMPSNATTTWSRPWRSVRGGMATTTVPRRQTLLATPTTSAFCRRRARSWSRTAGSGLFNCLARGDHARWLGQVQMSRLLHYSVHGSGGGLGRWWMAWLSNDTVVLAQ